MSESTCIEHEKFGCRKCRAARGRGASRKAAKVVIPEPVKVSSRICFGVAYFKTEADAEAFAAVVVARGDTYNGGWYHGMACGRDTTHDHEDPTLGSLYAVTTR